MRQTRTARGQAMVEVAIFGTFLLFGLSLLVRFGLQQYHSLQTQQEAFRYALKEAYETRAYNGQPGSRPPAGAERPELAADNSSQTLLVKDVYVPDPSDPFGTGQHLASVSSGAVQWGTDRAEFLNPLDDDGLPRVVAQINDKRVALHPARFRHPAIELFYTDPFLSQKLCQYQRAYRSLIVEVLDGTGTPIRDAAVGLQFCDLGGGALIQLPDGAPPAVKVRIRIIDLCAGDIISPQSCAEQCNRLADEGLTQPSYCSMPPVSPLDLSPQGLDLLNTVRTHQATNKLRLQETPTALQSHTIINESTTTKRTIKTNRFTHPADMDATTTAVRQRDQQWNTKW